MTDHLVKSPRPHRVPDLVVLCSYSCIESNSKSKDEERPLYSTVHREYCGMSTVYYTYPTARPTVGLSCGFPSVI